MKKYNITGMSCAACSARVEKVVSGIAGVTNCSVNLLTNSMIVEGNASEESIIAAVNDAGYGAIAADKKSDNTKSVDDISGINEIKKLKSRLNGLFS